MTDGPKGPDYRGTWKDWPFVAAGIVALLAVVGTLAGGRAGLMVVVVVLALLLTGLVRGGTFSSRR
jgi:hypothetical protein